MLDDNRTRLLREVQLQAETRLQALQQIALAADARAMQFGAACVAIAAVVVSLAESIGSSVAHHICVAMFVAAAGLSFWSGRASEWDAPGNAPHQFRADIDSNRSVSEVCAELLGHYDEMIADNSRLLVRNGKRFNAATIIAMCAPVASALTYAVQLACNKWC